MFRRSYRARVAGIATAVALIAGPVGVDAIGAAPAGAPGRPGRPTLTFAGSGRATVYWSRPRVAGSSRITAYVVRPYLGNRPLSATTLQSTATQGIVRGLTNGRTYQFRVSAVNASGVSDASYRSPPVTIGTPSPPRRVTAQAGDHRATVAWVAPGTNNGAAVTGYVVTPIRSGRRESARVYRSIALRQTLTGLRAGGRYRFSVQAVNRHGAGKPWLPSAPITVSGGAPPPVSGGACPTERPPSTYAGEELAVQQALEAAYSAGFRTVAQLRAVVGIGRAESSLTTKARRWHPEFGCRPAADVIGVQGPDAAWNAGHTRQLHADRGIWQVSSHFWPQFTDAQTDNPRAAAAVVWSISRHGSDFSPWNTWPSPAQSLAPSAATVQAFLARK